MNANIDRPTPRISDFLGSPVAVISALTLLFVATVIDGLSVEVMHLTVRPPYVVVPIAVIVALAACHVRKTPFVITLPGVFLILWLVVLIVASILSPLPLPSAPIDILRLSLLAAIFLVIPNLITDEEIGQQSLRILMTVIVAELVLSLILYGIQQVTGATVPGVRASYNECPVPAALGTMIESNFLGQLASVSMLVVVVLLYSPNTKINISPAILWAALVVSALAVLFSLARIAWIGSLLLLPVTLAIIPRHESKSVRRFLFGAGVSAGIAAIVFASLFVMPPSFGPVCRGWNMVRAAANIIHSKPLQDLVNNTPAYQRLQTVLQTGIETQVQARAQQSTSELTMQEQDQMRQYYLSRAQQGGSSILGRLTQATSGLEIWRLRPVIGWGVLGAKRVDAYKSANKTNNKANSNVWLGNLELYLLTDGGLVGAFVFALFVLSALWQAWDAGRRNNPPWDIVSRGFFVVFILLMLEFQTTHGVWIAIPYVIGGLLSAYGMLGVSPRELLHGRIVSVKF